MILVDGITEHDTKLRYKQWSHMVSDSSEEELHAMATKIGLRRDWFQGRPKSSAAHYDVTPTKRALAIKHGAVAVTSRELVLRNYDGLRRRGLLPMPPHEYDCPARLGSLECSCPGGRELRQ